MRVYEGQQGPRGSRRVREEFGGSGRVLDSGRALEDVGGSRRGLNSPKGSRRVWKDERVLVGQKRTIGMEDHGGMEGLLGSGRAHEGV